MLSIADLAARRPRIATEPEPDCVSEPPDDALVWPDADGEPLAICRFVGNRSEITLSGLGRLSAAETGEVSAFIRPGRTEDELLSSYFRLGLPLLLHARGAEVLHASAVVGAAGVVGFCAEPGTGKSTTAYGLSRRGYRAWADDALVFEQRDCIQAVGLPFWFRLCPDVCERFRDELDEQPAREPGAPVEVEPLAALCLLRRGDSAGRIERLGAAGAFRRVLVHSLSFQLSESERNARMIDTYMNLAAALPVYEASVGPDLEQLPVLLDAIEQEILGGAPGS